MEADAAKKIVDTAFKDVFGIDNPFSLDETKAAFAYDIPLPVKTKSIFGNDTTWGEFKKGVKVASETELYKKSLKGELMQPRKAINSMSELLKIWGEIDYYTGDRVLDSRDVHESDSIYGSAGIYRSMMMLSSQNMVFCYNCDSSKNLVASRDSFASTSSFRLNQTGYTSSSYDVIWSSKVSKSLFINNCFDLFECMFCNNIRSRKYCIANMQFEKEEYTKVKEMVLAWIVDGLKKRAKR